MKLPNIVLPAGRKLIFSFLVLALIISFFFSYNYYYIPSNRENVDRYGFLILENIKSGVLDKNSNLKKIYTTFLRDKDTSSLQSKLRTRNVEGKVKTRSPSPVIDSTVQLANINKNELIYSIGKDSNSTLISVPVKNKFKLFFDIRRNELFNSYMLLRITDGNTVSICLDENLPVGENINSDSLLPDKKGLFIAGIRDINVGNTDYKMFYYPFAMDNQQMMICGFVNNNDYKSKLQEIPASFIYTFVTVFLLLFITLPILKFFIMGPEEEIKFRDLFLFSLSLFIGSTLLTLVIIQIILLKDGDIRAERDLISLKNQISQNFTGEINKAYRQLSMLDTLVAAQLPSDSIKKIFRKDISGVIQQYLSYNKDDSTVYRDFDRIAWTDSAGQQFLKGELSSSPLYPVIKERKYFKDFAEGTPLQLPGALGELFGMEPVYNWVNGDFRTVISKRSKVYRAFITSLSTRMYPATKTILPAGYGFCIIDRGGNVQFHSDSSKNLHENFIEQLISTKEIKEAVASRQEVFLNNSGFYGKKYCSYISPLSQLPYYVITFYDRGYIVPINMRILVFALLLSTISCFTYALLWYFILWRGYYRRSLLLSPVSYLNWIIPKTRYAGIYAGFSIFLTAYICMLLALTFILNFADIGNNSLLLVIMLLSPLNIAAGFSLIIYRGQPIQAKEKNEVQNKLWCYIYLCGLSIALLMTMFSFKNKQQSFALIFELVFHILLLLYFFFAPYLLKPASERLKKKAFLLYNLFVVLLIIVTAVLPSALFTWYSHNQEIIQSVKKQQLFLAGKVNERAVSIKKETKDTSYYNNEYYKNLCLKRGIYSIYADSLYFIDSLAARDKENSFNDFYFNVSNAAGTGYFDPLFFPALKDTAADKKWQWNYRQADSLLIFSYNIIPDISGSTSGATQNNYLQVKSKLPERYVVLSDKTKLPVLIVLVLLIFLGIYSIVQNIIKNIFLRKFGGGLKTATEGIKALIDKYKKVPGSESIDEKSFLITDADSSQSISAADIVIKEEEIMNRIALYKKLYEFIWRDCSAKERYLLYDFARDGLMNFKNTPEIFSLLRKGIFCIREDGEVVLFDNSFRIYLTKFLPLSQITGLRKMFRRDSTWQSFSIPLLIMLIAAACFIFFTQQEIWQKSMALLTGLLSILPLIVKAFTSSSKAKE